MCKKQVLGLFVIFNFLGYTIMLIFPPVYRKGKLRFRADKYLVPEHTASECQDLFLLYIYFPGSWIVTLSYSTKSGLKLFYLLKFCNLCLL